MERSIFLNELDVNNFLIDDSRCSSYVREEIIQTLRYIDSKKGRRWLFNNTWSEYLIHEYNEYNEFVMTYKFKL
jgi:hypothetical protein